MVMGREDPIEFNIIIYNISEIFYINYYNLVGRMIKLNKLYEN